jgi:hypothetical protein
MATSAAGISRILNARFGKGAYTVITWSGGVEVRGEGLPPAQAKACLTDKGYVCAPSGHANSFRVGSRR